MTEPTAVVVPGVKFKQTVLVYNGYIFHKNKTDRTSNTTYYRCKIPECSARGSIRGSQPFVLTRQHINHVQSPLKEKKMSVMSKIKERAVCESTSLKDIFLQETQKPEAQDCAQYIGYGNVVSGLEKLRNKAIPPIPKNIEEMGELLDDITWKKFAYSKCESEERKFYRGCLLTQDVHALFFAEDCMLNGLKSAKMLQVDGTFKVCPRTPKVRQLLTIQFRIGEHIFPAVYVFMTAKSYSAYNAVFNFISLKLCPGMSPKTIMTDFEDALRKALTDLFPMAKLVGCMFHFSQCIYKQVIKCGLSKMYKKNKDCSKAVGMLMATALLPVHQIREGFEAACAFARQQKIFRKLEKIFNYFERQWLQKEGPDSFCVFAHRHRTNNAIESFHRNLMRLVKSPHPNVWNLIDKLLSYALGTCNDLARQQNGLKISRTRKLKYLMQDRKVASYTRLLLNGAISPSEFLEKASYLTYNPSREKENTPHRRRTRKEMLPTDSDSEE